MGPALLESMNSAEADQRSAPNIWRFGVFRLRSSGCAAWRIPITKKKTSASSRLTKQTNKPVSKSQKSVRSGIPALTDAQQLLVAARTGKEVYDWLMKDVRSWKPIAKYTISRYAEYIPHSNVGTGFSLYGRAQLRQGDLNDVTERLKQTDFAGVIIPVALWLKESDAFRAEERPGWESAGSVAGSGCRPRSRSEGRSAPISRSANGIVLPSFRRLARQSSPQAGPSPW